MSSVVAKFALWSNNLLLQKVLVSSDLFSKVDFLEYKSSTDCPYVVAFIDLASDLGDISQKIISLYSSCQEQKQKLAVLVSHGEKIDVEKNLYFTQLLDRLGDGHPLHRLILIKDLYTENLLEKSTWLENHLVESLVNKSMVISAKGEKAYYPLHLQDLVLGLQKSFFLSGTTGATFWMVGDPFTDLEIAYLLKKELADADGPFEIDSTGPNLNELDLNSLGNQTRAALNWEPISDFPQTLKKVIKQVLADKTLLISSLHQNHLTTKNPFLKIFTSLKRSTHHFIQKMESRQGSRHQVIETSRGLVLRAGEIIFFTITAVYFSLTVSFVVFSCLSLLKLENSLAETRKGNITEAVQILQKSNLYTNMGESSYNLVAPIFTVLAPDFHEKNHNLFVFLNYSGTSLENLQQTYLLAEKIYQSIGSENNNLNYRDASLALQSNLSQVYENLNQIRLLSQSGKLPTILDQKIKNSSEYKNISLVEQQITQLLKTVDLLPAFLVGEQAKNIIIVFENSLELRSTGGTNDYLLALVLDHGKVISRRLYDGPEIDSLLSSPPISPTLVNLYTGSNKWSFRDLGYNPDFVATSENLSLVIEKSLKIKPDVILAVNDSFISSVLAETGPAQINGQSITADVFKEQLASSSPNPLYRQLIEHYLNQFFEHRLSMISLGRVLTTQSINGQLLFWTADSNLEKIIINQPYSGAIFSHQCHTSLIGQSPCLSETTYLNESNFSLVPVGPFLKKKITHNVSFQEGGTLHKYFLEYHFIKNFPDLNRDLNEVLQLYSPDGSLLSEVVVNGKNLNPKVILQQKDNGLQRFQIPLSLKFNQDNQVQISFFAPSGINAKPPFSYSLTEYRQPGLTPDEGNIELLISLPTSFRASLITSAAVSIPNGFSFVYPNKTSTFGLHFEPK